MGIIFKKFSGFMGILLRNFSGILLRKFCGFMGGTSTDRNDTHNFNSKQSEN